MARASTPRSPRPNPRRLLLLVLAGLAGCILTLAYSPSLADSLESLLFVEPPPPPAPPDLMPDLVVSPPAIDQPPTLAADKVALDDDTPVIGVLASGKARAYLVEAFELGPPSHVVNDVLGGVPVSVTHCDISGCTQVFTGDTAGRPLELSVGGLRDHRMVLKFDGHTYRQETHEPLDGGSSLFPYRRYPAELTAWGSWRQAHPRTDVYMGTVEEATPAEAGGPPKVPHLKPPTPAHHPS